jgi:hypothetical protein
MIEGKDIPETKTAEEMKLTPHGFHHSEAFALMIYRCESCGTRERLYNSRDGVTPFIINCRDCKGNMMHIDWQGDECLPGYVPKRGQRVFIDTPKEVFEMFTRAKINFFWLHSEYPLHKRYNSKKEAFDEFVKEYKKEEPYIITWDLVYK